jgi:CRISPR/Cas system CMR subunit Cmr4 (Cas7 group RAMP superfamily)
MSNDIIYTHRYIARVILEAETPLFVGSGESSLLKDAPVQRDIHGFPMIQGTSLAGVLRHSLEDFEQDNEKWNSFFGYQSTKGKEGLGSKVKISSAHLVLKDGKVAEGLTISQDLKVFQKNHFENLPSRQHVRITDKGVADTNKAGLFDNEVVYKGCRFMFEIELKGTNTDQDLWHAMLCKLKSPLFRIGQGTRKGYGNLSVISCKTKEFDLTTPSDFTAYLNFDNSLNTSNDCLQEFTDFKNGERLLHYKLVLKPESFFMFGAGFGDNEVDNIPVTEDVVFYEKGNIQAPTNQTLIPASSIKGALSHRTAFHYNRKIQRFADKYANEIKSNTKTLIEFVETYNDAVYELFGAEEGPKNREGQRGKIILNDVLQSNITNDNIFNHVAIDRFTGGAMEGALFSEKVSYFEDKNEVITLDIFVDNYPEFGENIIEAFEEALKDICKGLLPLGGMTTKGHGIFTGNLFKDDKEEFSYAN